MRFFRKKRGDDIVIDLGKLKRIESETGESGSLTSSASPIESGSLTSSASPIESGSLTSYSDFSGIASLATANKNEETETNVTNINEKLNEKLASLSSRVYSLTEKLDLLEHKIKRLERRAGFEENSI